MRMPSVVSMRLFIACCLALVIVTSGGNLVATFLQNHQVARQLQSQQNQFERQLQAQQQQNGQQRKISMEVDAKLCTSFGSLAALRPPGGATAANPSRLYEQNLHNILAGLGTDIGCTVVAAAGG